MGFRSDSVLLINLLPPFYSLLFPNGKPCDQNIFIFLNVRLLCDLNFLSIPGKFSHVTIPADLHAVSEQMRPHVVALVEVFLGGLADAHTPVRMTRSLAGKETDPPLHKQPVAYEWVSVFLLRGLFINGGYL